MRSVITRFFLVYPGDSVIMESQCILRLYLQIALYCMVILYWNSLLN